MQLYPHQGQALEQTKDFNRVAYYLDMGLGKTFVGSEKMCDLRKSCNLIICQKSKIDDWMQHFKTYYSPMQDKGRFHPTQKPVALYTWLLNNYAEKGDKILDTHVGSASSLIACHNMGFNYMGCELDEYYFRMATERLEAHKSQLRLF